MKPPKYKTFHSGYMSRAWSFDLILADAQAMLKGKRYDTLVGTGLSGAIVVPRLADALGKEALIIRKPNDGSHSWLPAEGTLGHRWIFVDDFIDSGATLASVREVIKNLTKGDPPEWPSPIPPFVTTEVGMFLYNAGRFYRNEAEYRAKRWDD